LASATGRTDEGPLVASPALIAATRKLRPAESDAIPFVIAPRKYMPAWTGGDDGGADYDRACAVDGVGALKIGQGQGLVVSEPGGLMFWPTDTGGLLVIWHGADSATGCIAAALSIPNKQYKKQRATLTVAKGAEELVIFDSFSRGDSLKRTGKIGDDGLATFPFRLSPGTVDIAVVWNYEAEVKVGKRVEDTMVGVLRLERR